MTGATPRDREAAWREFYLAHHGFVFRAIARMGVPSRDIEDLVQDVFLIVEKKLDEVGEVRHVRAWLRGIAYKRVADYRRWAKVRRVKQWVVDQLFSEPTAPWTGPEQSLEVRQANERMQAILDAMPPKLREVFVLAELSEYPPREIAELLSIPVNTVRSRTRLARASFETLRAELDTRAPREVSR